MCVSLHVCEFTCVCACVEGGINAPHGTGILCCTEQWSTIVACICSSTKRCTRARISVPEDSTAWRDYTKTTTCSGATPSSLIIITHMALASTPVTSITHHYLNLQGKCCNYPLPVHHPPFLRQNKGKKDLQSLIQVWKKNAIFIVKRTLDLATVDPLFSFLMQAVSMS